MNEAQLVKECIKGNEQCRTMLYNQYSKVLYGIALRYTSGQEDAKDVLQEAFISIFNHLHQFNGTGSLQAWMSRIVINQALKLYQVNKKAFPVENYEDYQEQISDISITDSDKLSYNVLLGFIRELPDGYRMVFNLCEIEGYSYDEVSGILHCSNATCRSQLFKAKNALRKKVVEFTKKESLL
ncbi:MAG: sigma-70 family RNA polymerase sigma factor [Bacteroidales bacterium]|nr:sigma-70 family RNA polymerase sigma factor [Bacteroidales bacterium]